MFDDQGANQNDENQMNGVDDAAASGMGTGAISDPSNEPQNEQDVSEPTLVHPSSPPQDESSNNNPEEYAQEEPEVQDNTPSLGGSNFGPADNSTDDSSSVSAAPSNDDVSAPAEPRQDNDNNDLVSIRKQALEQLSPLVSKLDQSPEDKYKTLMMMIQASDNQALIKEAYENAQNITDEKAKAEALLNIVNEINYFTQK